MKKYAVVIEKGRGNYSAYVPDLPGCVATGRTVAATKANIRGAIAMHLEGLHADGVRPPAPSASAVYVNAGPSNGSRKRTPAKTPARASKRRAA